MNLQQKFYSVIGFISLFMVSVVQAQESADHNEKFWQALQEGGKVILMRHADIDRSMGSSFILDSSCFEERNLTDLGRKQAKAVNKQFTQHHIKIDQVLASPHCRTKETAKLAFGYYKVEPLLRLTKALTVDKANENMLKVKEMIGNYTGLGNLVLVTHRPNVGELALIRVAPAELVVLQPLGDGLFDTIARAKLD